MTVAWEHLLALGWPLLAALAIGFVVLRSVATMARRDRHHPGHRFRARLLAAIAAPAALTLPLFFLLVAVQATPLRPEWAKPMRHALAVAGLLALTWLAVRLIGAIEQRILRQHPVDIADNLAARRVQTQTRVLSRVAQGGAVLVGVSIALMTFPAIRQLGMTLLASAGIIGLVAGIAARPVFGNLIAGLQIALAQPIRLDDVVIVEGEWGRVEEITSTYVVVRVWDERRLVVPLQWFIENPFQNWTRTTAQLLGTAFLWLDYRAPMAAIREELTRICESDERWDGRVCVAQVTDADQHTLQVRLLVSSCNSGALFDLRCAVRERMIEFLQQNHPECLPRWRLERGGAVDHPPPGDIPGGHAPEYTASPGAEDVTPEDRIAHAGGARD
ncbi:MAG: mechanosensitive ion channel [Xanthomonadales bacterium]|nr:mechanosensitive ion channel [Xanthomonadales bacterium]